MPEDDNRIATFRDNKLRAALRSVPGANSYYCTLVKTLDQFYTTAALANTDYIKSKKQKKQIKVKNLLRSVGKIVPEVGRYFDAVDLEESISLHYNEKQLRHFLKIAEDQQEMNNIARRVAGELVLTNVKTSESFNQTVAKNHLVIMIGAILSGKLAELKDLENATGEKRVEIVSNALLNIVEGKEIHAERVKAASSSVAAPPPIRNINDPNNNQVIIQKQQEEIRILKEQREADKKEYEAKLEAFKKEQEANEKELQQNKEEIRILKEQKEADKKKLAAFEKRLQAFEQKQEVNNDQVTIQKQKEETSILTSQMERIRLQVAGLPKGKKGKQQAQLLVQEQEKLAEQLKEQHREKFRAEFQPLADTEVSEEKWEEIEEKFKEILKQPDTEAPEQTNAGELQPEVSEEVLNQFKKQIALMQERCAALAAFSDEYQLKDAEKKALDQKLKDPNAQEYYYTLITEMNRLFMAASVAQTGYIAAQNKPGGVSSRASKLLKGIGKLVPNFGGYFEAAGGMVEAVGLHYTKSYLNAVADMAHSPSSMERIVKTVAYKLVMNTPEYTLDAAKARKDMEQMINTFRNTELGDKRHDEDAIIDLFLQALGQGEAATVEFEAKKPGVLKRCWKAFTSCISSTEGTAETLASQESRFSQDMALKMTFSGSADPNAVSPSTGGGTGLTTHNKPRM